MEVMKKYYENNSLKSIFYMNDAFHFHNDNGPAIVEYYEDGTLSSEYWYINGKKHNNNGPAEIWYSSDGSVQKKAWYINGYEQRENHPTCIWYFSSGIVRAEYWRYHGNMHRIDGPAEITYNEKGQITYISYSIDGVQINMHSKSILNMQNNINNNKININQYRSLRKLKIILLLINISPVINKDLKEKVLERITNLEILQTLTN